MNGKGMMGERLGRGLEVALGLGWSEASRLRGWYRRISLSEAGTRGRLSLLKRAALWPLKAMRLASMGSREYGPLVEEAYGMSIPRQFIQQWWLSTSTGMPPEKYYALRLFLPERWAVARDFMLSEEMHVLFMALARRQSSEEAAQLDDKESFRAWCREHDLPTARTLWTFEAGRARPADLSLDEPLPPTDLFSKPKNFRWGIGAARWFWIGKDSYRTEAGACISTAELINELERQSLERSVVLQERLSNHSVIADLSSGALCTVRIATSRFPGGQAEAVGATFRMPVGSTPVDNFSSGGIAATVDLSHGTLSPAVSYDLAQCTDQFHYHPDTGAAITDRLLPYWAEAVVLAKRAHQEAMYISSVGWDIAFLEAGPHLIEANVSWGVVLLQMPSGIPITRTPFATHQLSHLRHEYQPKVKVMGPPGA